MTLAERLSSKFHTFPQSVASRPNIHFSDNLSAADITASQKGLFTNYSPLFATVRDYSLFAIRVGEKADVIPKCSVIVSHVHYCPNISHDVVYTNCKN